MQRPAFYARKATCQSIRLLAAAKWQFPDSAADPQSLEMPVNPDLLVATATNSGSASIPRPLTC